ncbi:hypothetical protein ACFY04_40220 [Streptomyces sp. NPDC001549]
MRGEEHLGGAGVLGVARYRRPGRYCHGALKGAAAPGAGADDA